jgi:alkaline phosphatase D
VQGRGDGAPASTQYYYRFTTATDVSRTGRIRTAPAPLDRAATFAFTGDSNAFFKPFSVLEGITRDDPDLFLYIGDTIYSDDTRSGTGEAMVLGDYRAKYAENRDDSALRDVMANDRHGDHLGRPRGHERLLRLAVRRVRPADRRGQPGLPRVDADPRGRRRPDEALPQHQVGRPRRVLPDRLPPVPRPAGLRHRARVSQRRQSRDAAAGGRCQTEINNPSRTYLGAAQKAWLKNALAASTAKWKFIMNGPVITA